MRQLQSSLSQIFKQSLETDYEEFSQLVREATRLLRNENGVVGNFEIVGRLVRIKPAGEAMMVGDLHGNLESLIDIMRHSNFLEKMEKHRDAVLIFLGDYGDRGAYSTEVYYTILKLKLLYPEQVVLMRGNHEGPEDLKPSPHDLPMQFQAKFAEKGLAACAKIRDLFTFLYNAVLVEERYLFIHGGLPSTAKTIEDLAYAHVAHPRQSFLEDMLWSDPDETASGVSASPRGAGKLFGERITDEVLEGFNVKILIRGHEACEDGYRINHHGKVLTLFSCKGPPYFNAHGAYLNVELARKFERAKQLIPYIHRF